MAIAAFAATGSAHAASVFTPAGPAVQTVPNPSSIAFSPSGIYAAAASASGGPIGRYELTGSAGLKPYQPSSACSGNSVAFKPTGSVLAVTNGATNTVSLCSMSEADGSLTALGSPIPTGLAPDYVQFSPNGKFIATLDIGLSMFRVGAATLEPVGGDYGTHFLPTSARFSPDSRFLLVTSGCPIRDTMHVYAVASDGSLLETDVRSPPHYCATDSVFVPQTNQLVVLSVDRYDPRASELTTYELSGRGTLQQLGAPVPAGTGATRLAVSRDGRLLSYTSVTDHTLTLVERAADGALTPVASAPTGDEPSSVAFDPRGDVIGVTTVDSPRIQLFRVASGPALIPTGAPTVLGGASSYVAASGDRVAITTYSPPGVELYELGSGGGLTKTDAIDNATLSTPHGLALSPNGRLLAVTSGMGTPSTAKLTIFRVSEDGHATAVSDGAPDAGPIEVAFSPDGSLVATANLRGSVSLFSVSPDGALTPRGDFDTTGSDTRSVSFSSDGRLLVTADEGGGTVSLFSVNGTSLGAPRRIFPGGNPTAVAFQPNGSVFAEVDFSTSRVHTYALDGSGGAAPVDSAAVPFARTAAFTPDGKRMIVVGEDVIQGFSVSADGRLTPFGDPTPSDLLPAGVAFAAGGAFFVATQQAGATAWVYPMAAPVLKAAFASTPGPYSRMAQVPFTFDASYPSTFECRVDTAPFAACDRTTIFAVSAAGAHTAEVRAVDHAGNRSAVARASWIRDATPPVPAALGAPADGASGVAVAAAFSWTPASDAVAGVASYHLIVDGSATIDLVPGDCTASRCTAQAPHPLTDGPHTWTVRVTDRAGNESAAPPQRFTVDARPPVAAQPVAPTGGGTLGTANPRLSWSAAVDDGAGVRSYDVLVDDVVVAGDLPAETTAWTVATGLADGRHTWAVRATDRNGNAVTSPPASFFTDQTPPEARLVVRHEDLTDAPGPPFFLGELLTFDASASTDPGGVITSYAWDLDGDGQPDPGVSGPQVTKSLNAKVGGRYPITLFVGDAGGHVSALPYEVIVDATRYDVSFYASLEDARAQEQVASFTRSETVYLRVNYPTEATAIQIGNQFGQAQVQTFPAVREPIKWTFNAFRDPKRSSLPTSAGVSITFLRGRRPIPGNVYGSIGVDLSAPTVKAPAVSTAGPYPLLTGTVSDKGSGATEVQVTTNPKKPKKKFAKIKGKKAKGGKTKLRQPLRRVRSVGKATGAADFVPGKPVYIRFRDAIGNVSKFCRVSGRGKPGGPGRCRR